MTIRLAVASDAASIASLHARSWQTAYRGILSTEFLEGPVIANRLQLWQERFSETAPHNQYILVSEHESAVQGFACAYLDADREWGTLLDNLHVEPRYQGRGLGAQLMAMVAQKIRRDGLKPTMHLWVYEQNDEARRFYERLSGTPADRVAESGPDGGRVNAVRYVWRQLEVLALCGRG